MAVELKVSTTRTATASASFKTIDADGDTVDIVVTRYIELADAPDDDGASSITVHVGHTSVTLDDLSIDGTPDLSRDYVREVARKLGEALIAVADADMRGG